MTYNIGYVDEDPKQVKKFSRLLRDHGFNVTGYDIEKGMPSDELIRKIYDSEIDLLMIDYLLKSKGVLTFNGDEIERKYNEIRPNFPHIIFTSHAPDALNDVDNPNIIYEKEMVTERIDQFVEILKKNIRLYQDYVKQRKESVTKLVEKSQAEDLTVREKEDLLKAQFELGNLDTKSKKEIPLEMMTLASQEKIEALRKESEEFLEQLIKKRK